MLPQERRHGLSIIQREFYRILIRVDTFSSDFNFLIERNTISLRIQVETKDYYYFLIEYRKFRKKKCYISL